MYRRMKDLRNDRDKTQTDIANVLGTSYQYYATYEDGTRDIPLRRAIILAKYYKVSLDYLAGLSDDPHQSWV